MLLTIITVFAFTYPFWIDLGGLRVGSWTQSTAAPLIAAAVGLVVVTAVAFQLERRALRPAMLSVLAVLGTVGGLARVFDLPAGGNLIFVVIVLGSVAYGVEFGFLLGLSSMGIGALLAGGLGPWLPFQMLAAAALGAICGGCSRWIRASTLWRSRTLLAMVGAAAALFYGFIINMWEWPFLRQHGALTWVPGAGVTTNLQHYWRYYLTTSLAWDTAGAALNAIVLFTVGAGALRVLAAHRARLSPRVIWQQPQTPTPISPESFHDPVPHAQSRVQ